jgi:two-component system sensor histidine kinase KdpD
VLIEASAAPGALVFAVEDDGPGLSGSFAKAEQMDALFNKFTRGVEESPTSGVGLGLAICRAIVEAHGGTIAVDTQRHLPQSSGRRGFRVVVTLPRGAPPVVEDEPLVESHDVMTVGR